MRGKELILVGLGYLIITLLLLWPIAIHLSSIVIDAGDPLFYVWNLSHNWFSFTHGLTSLLDTNIYYPTTNTLAFSDTLFGQTFLMAPVLWLTRNPLLAENLYVLLTFPIAGLGMYLLTYHLTKHKGASFVAGLFFAFSLPRLGQISHVPAISSQWFPFLIYSLLLYLETGKQRDLLFYALWLVLLTASSVYFFVFASIATLIMMVVYGNIQRIIRAIPVGILLIIVLIPLNYPYIRLKAEQPEIKRNIEEAAVFAAYQEDYYAVLPSTRLLSNLLPIKDGERALFPTFTVIVLALSALFFIKKWSKGTMLISLVGLGALLLSFGPSRPFHIGPIDTGYLPLPYKFAYKLFPLLQIIRVPARFSILVAFALSILAAVTIALHPKLKDKRWIPVLAGFLFLVEIWQTPFTGIRVPTYKKIPAVYQFLKQQSNIHAMVELPLDNIEQGKTPIGNQVKKQYNQLTIDDPLATEAYRVYFAGYHLKMTANGYSGFIPTSYHETVNAMRSFPSDDSIAFLKHRGISHVIVHLWQYPEEQKKTIMTSLQTFPQLTQVARFNDDIVYAIVISN